VGILGELWRKRSFGAIAMAVADVDEAAPVQEGDREEATRKYIPIDLTKFKMLSN